MSLLHDYFNTRNLQAFQRLLDGSAERAQVPPRTPPSSAPIGSYPAKSSWTRSAGSMGSQKNPNYEVNAKDWLGRTALHLACASLESIEYVRALLKHPQIDVNLADTESQWTPLHRALYSANFPAALLLLQRSDVDASLKDTEGYTAFDLYNSTLNGTKPDNGGAQAELYTWGANRNATLGVGDSDDRVHPEHVQIKHKENPSEVSKMSISTRFSPIFVRELQMSKFHTAVVTTEKEGNLRLCGFGSGGRLGPGQTIQYSLNPMVSCNLSVVSVALGQDHTLVLTKAGEVYSWGMNHFSQLGYVVEVATGGLSRHDEPIQPVPKRVVGALRKEAVRGIAASKKASACWTSEVVYTWGTNSGQLGYDRNAQPVQVLPRAVTKFTNAVIGLSMSDTVLAGLLVTGQVECIWSDRQSRIVFPMHSFSANFQPYRPIQAVKDAHIVKVTCCEENFAALSSNGEVFTFSAPTESSSLETRVSGPVFKPQKVWALRKKFSAVKDVSLSSDGSIIICTESGHVYVRIRNAKAASNKTFKFERIPFLQRVAQVCANSTGAFGALRVDHRPVPIEVTGNAFAQDLKSIQPYLAFYERDDASRQVWPTPAIGTPLVEDEPEDVGIQNDIECLSEFLDVLAAEQRVRKAAGGNCSYDGVRLPHDADTMVHTSSGAAFPVHRIVLAARSSLWEGLLSRSTLLIDTNSKLSIKLIPARPGPGLGVLKITRIMITGCHPLSILILFRYLYTDELLAVWDRRVYLAVDKRIAGLEVNPNQIRLELQAFARLLDLPALTLALEPPVKREPSQTMVRDMTRLFETVQAAVSRTSSLAPNVVLELADREVYTHSAILRARTTLFGSFFNLKDWTDKRWGADGVIRINLKHMRWYSFRYVAAFMCGGGDQEMFNFLESVNSIEDVLALTFEVASLANELLLDRLISICASVILTHCNLSNACYILADATYYSILPLTQRLQEYISVNMESFLQRHMLDDVPYFLVKQLAKYVKARQIEKSPFSRSMDFVNGLLKKHALWLAEQDTPEPFVRRTPREPLKKEISGSKLSPEMSSRILPMTTSFTTPTKAIPPQSVASPSSLRDSSGEDIFVMDEAELDSRASSYQEPNEVSGPLSPSPIWKANNVPKADMKAIMAEAQAASQSLAMASRQRTSQNVSQSPKSMTTVRPSPGSPSQKTSSKSDSKMAWRSLTAESSTRAAASDFPTVQSTPAESPMPRLPTSSTPSGLSIIRSLQNLPTASSSRNQPPGFGPVITPIRQSSAKASPSSGKTWFTPDFQPIPKASPSTGMSFMDIQNSQKKQVLRTKDKRSLKEIQEEEQSLQAEADFLKWWTAEEERVKQEATALAQFEKDVKRQQQSVERSSGPSKRRPQNKKNDGKTPVGQGQNPGEGASETKQPQNTKDARKGKKPDNPRRGVSKQKEQQVTTV